ncbi:MAG: hypothetical protein GX436_09880 [Synergistaceae bacterium]|jgi:hypothetical protein|nr:hypothetical protein [Synergistaceae bacterium]
MTGDLAIRQAVIGGLPRVVEIFDAYRQYFGQKSDPEGVEKFLFDRFEHRDSVMFVAEKDGRMLGFPHLYPLVFFPDAAARMDTERFLRRGELPR